MPRFLCGETSCKPCNSTLSTKFGFCPFFLSSFWALSALPCGGGVEWLKGPPGSAILSAPMLKRMCTAKIANAFVTQAVLHYEGSLGVDASILEAAKIQPYEMV